MAQEPYDDDLAVQLFLDRFWTEFLTEFERTCYRAALRKEKADAQAESKWTQSVRVELEREANEEIRSAVAEGFDNLAQRLREKVLLAFKSGVLKVNRCPRCHAVARTPTAKQCFGCGNDWH